MPTFASNQPFNVCVTAQHEYLILGSICVAVRERQSGEWLDDHYAIDERVSLVPSRRDASGMSRWALQISTFGNQVRVGPLERVERADQGHFHALATQLGLRFRAVGPEADEFELRDMEPLISATLGGLAVH